MRQPANLATKQAAKGSKMRPNWEELNVEINNILEELKTLPDHEVFAIKEAASLHSGWLYKSDRQLAEAYKKTRSLSNEAHKIISRARELWTRIEKAALQEAAYELSTEEVDSSMIGYVLPPDDQAWKIQEIALAGGGPIYAQGDAA
ncbi:MAG: hypothetical protein N2690_03560 [Rhodocyclaceae bacterium]|nr:hypothetical protein [Rhodocyclaceae bacterium]